MKTKTALLLMLLPMTAGIAANKATPASTEVSASTEELSPAAVLASQVGEIASTTSLSHKEQAKLIGKAVRVAVGAVIEGVKDPAERLNRAQDLAVAAAKAAPDFIAIIKNAITTLPAFSKVDGIGEQIDAAVAASVQTGDDTAIANPAVNPPRPPANPEFGGPNRGEVVVSPSS